MSLLTGDRLLGKFKRPCYYSDAPAVSRSDRRVDQRAFDVRYPHWLRHWCGASRERRVWFVFLPFTLTIRVPLYSTTLEDRRASALNARSNASCVNCPLPPEAALLDVEVNSLWNLLREVVKVDCRKMREVSLVAQRLNQVE